MTPGHTTESTTGLACHAGKHSLHLSAQQAVAAAAGMALLALGVVIAPQTLPIGPVLITLGGIVVLFGLAMPLVSQVELGAPMVAKVTIATGERRRQIRETVEDFRGLLVACATNLCPDGTSALRAVEACLSKGIGDWRGTDRTALRPYLLCLLVQQARFEMAATSLAPADGDRFSLLPLHQREVLVLLDRAGLDRTTVAQMLTVSVPEVDALRAQALASLQRGTEDPARDPP